MSISDYLTKNHPRDGERPFEYDRRIAKELGSTRDTIKQKRLKLTRKGLFPKMGVKKNLNPYIEPKETVDNQTEYEEKEGTAILGAKRFKSRHTDRVKVLNDFLQTCQVDLEKWEVERYSLNAWDVTISGKKSSTDKDVCYTNYQIKVWLKLKNKPLEEAIIKYIEKIPLFQYSDHIPKFNPGSGVALEMATLDAHLGKLSWMVETGYRNYDLNIASKDLEYAVDKNLNWASPFKPEKIFYIIGQDLFHVDNIQNHTTNGSHTLDVDGRMPKIFEKALIISTESIYKCRSVAPVEVIWSPGNHDYLTSMFLCYALREHFKDDKYVKVDIWKEHDGQTTRKARLWGNLLVGWTHRIVSRQEVWGNELAQAFPEWWAKSKFREWHHGDQHKKKTIKTMPEFTSGGVLCRQLTALSPVDKWHFENLFTDAVPGGEAFLWSKDMGVFANLIAWTGQYEKNRNKLVEP